MTDFINYLDKIESLIKSKDYDQAWAVANEGLTSIKGEDRFMMYYQMAIIAAREKKWFNSLEKMGFVIHYLRGLGGTSHARFVTRLLKKYKKENDLEEYVELAIKTNPRDFATKLSAFLSLQLLRV